VMLDLAKGQVLHRVRHAYGPDRNVLLTVEGVPVLVDLFTSLQMTNDGKYLFTGGNRIQRFRVAGEDLVFEESSAELETRTGAYLALSSDGKWVGIPAGRGSGSSGVAVFDALHLAKPRFRVATRLPASALAFDPKTGNIYAPDGDGINVFSPRGEEVEQVRFGGIPPRRILVDPRGESFLASMHDQVVSWRFRGAKPPE